MDSSSKILLFFDLQRTLEGIHEQNVDVFMRSVELVREKLQASEAIVVVSSHLYSPKSARGYMECLRNHASSTIHVAPFFYLHGCYDFGQEKILVENVYYNLNKLQRFEKEYLIGNDGVRFIGVFDDCLDFSCQSRLEEYAPTFCCRPSQDGLEPSFEENCYVTNTFGFDGVLEGLDILISSLDKTNFTNLRLKKNRSN